MATTEGKAETKQESKPEAKPESSKEVEENQEPPLKYKVNHVFAFFLKKKKLRFHQTLFLHHSFPCFPQAWVLKVSIHCEGCKRKVEKTLRNIQGTSKTISHSIPLTCFCFFFSLPGLNSWCLFPSVCFSYT